MPDHFYEPDLSKYRFHGFRSPNYTQVPDEFFDELLPQLNLGELKVLLYVMRRTFGFKKGSDRISKSQLENGITKTDGQVLDRGTGLSRRAIRLAVQSLVEKNILLKRSHRTARWGDESTEYALNILGGHPWVSSTQGGGVVGTHREGTQVPPQKTVVQETEYTRRVPSSSTKRDTAHDLVAYFHEQAGHTSTQKPLPKEYGQASELIEAQGFDRARRIVRFALDRAAETHFHVRHFGAVLGYVHEALTALDAEHHHHAELDAIRDELQQHDTERRTELAAFQKLPLAERVTRRLSRYPAALYSPERLARLRSRIEQEEAEHDLEPKSL